jgi:hypothetical protein
MATAWAGFKVTSTFKFQSDFGRVVTNGACDGISLLPRYWSGRIEAEFASISLNVLAMFVSCFLTWKLVKVSPFSSIQWSISTFVSALWVADFQASRRLTDYQSSLPNSPYLVHHHPTVLVFHHSHGISVVGSAVEPRN